MFICLCSSLRQIYKIKTFKYIKYIDVCNTDQCIARVYYKNTLEEDLGETNHIVNHTARFETLIVAWWSEPWNGLYCIPFHGTVLHFWGGNNSNNSLVCVLCLLNIENWNITPMTMNCWHDFTSYSKLLFCLQDDVKQGNQALTELSEAAQVELVNQCEQQFAQLDKVIYALILYLYSWFGALKWQFCGN